MKTSDFKDWAKSFLAQGGILVFFIMAFEVMIMISPFAFFFYSVFNPIFHWLDAYPMTRWLTHFFLPHMILPPTTLLKMIRISGSVLFVVGSVAFAACALQVYLGKIFKRGIANRGIYHFIRHPQYTSLGLWGLGMAILWPRFIVLFTLSIMYLLYYFLAKDEERRMLRQFGQAYEAYMRRTGMFFPPLRKNRPSSSSASPFQLKNLVTLVSIVIVVIGTGFVCRAVTLNSLRFQSKGNVTLVAIMPEDGEKEAAVLNAVESANIEFLVKRKKYLGYEMPVDYIMQGMIANTGTEHHLYKQHHTIGLIADWVLHPFEHLRRSPSGQMAKMRNVDPSMARRHHCPLGINDPNMDCNDCEYRRVIFVEADNPSGNNISGKGFFAFNTIRIPIGFIDINTKTGRIINKKRVAPKTAWSDVPTPGI